MTAGTETITTIHLVWMGLLALLVVVGIVAGVRLKRRRVQAAREVQVHAEEAGVPPEPPASAADPREDRPEPVDAAPVPSAPDAPPAPSPIADEPIAAVVAADGTTATLAADAETVEPVSSPGDGPITQLKGLGPKVAARLNELGIDRVGQLAALDEAEAARLDAELGPFAGRMARDRWVEQARLLAADDRAGFERVFGRL